MKATVQMITPETAKRMYDTSRGNRTIRKSAVDAYARDMKSGNWLLNGESICFDENGVLIDGHHRLLACISSGTAFETLVVREVPEGTIIYDRGIGRKTQDNFKFAGEETWKCQSDILAVARRYLLIIEPTNKVPSDSEILDCLNKNEDSFRFVSSLINANNHSGSKTIHRKSQIMVAVLFAHMCGVPEAVLNRFITVLATGFYENTGETSAIVLRNAIIGGKFGRNTANDLSLMRTTESAIYNFHKGFSRRFLKENGIYSVKVREKYREEKGEK